MKTCNLKERRMAKNLSQAELSRKADVPIATLQMYEQRVNNINNARAVIVQRLATALDCSVAELLEK